MIVDGSVGYGWALGIQSASATGPCIMESPSGTTLHIIYLIVFISKFLGDLC
jgi:hypothetical protein